MSSLFKKIGDIPEPELLEATLLSEEEWRECFDYIKPVSNLTGYFYLRTEYEDGLDSLIGIVTAVDPDWLEPGEPDIMPMGIMGGVGIRPAVRIASPVLSDDITLKPGDRITLGEIKGLEAHFTVISETMLLLDDYINFNPYNVDDFCNDCYEPFDGETSIYENSAAKKMVDEWFENLKDNLK